MTHFLDVPFDRKDTAKTLGARWHATRRQWFVPHALDAERRARLIAAFPKAAADAQPSGIPSTVTRDFTFPGEDRNFGGKILFVDLIPSSCWFTNIHSATAPHHWPAVRHVIIERAEHRCECCGAGGRIDCHERWDFDRGTHRQTLKRLVALCQPCHTATHFGLAQIRGLEPQARQHIQTVNGWSWEQTDAHIFEAFDLWAWRSEQLWGLDISMIERAGIETAGPVDGETRRQVAEWKTRETRKTENSGVADYVRRLMTGEE